MKRHHLLLVVMLLAVMSATAASAQSGPFSSTFTVTEFTSSNGGGISTGALYSLEDVLGQPVAGEVSGGAYTLTGGLLAGSPTVDNLVLLYFNGDNNLTENVLEAARQAQAGAAITKTVTVVLMVLDGPQFGDSFLYRLDPHGATDCNFYKPPENAAKCEGRYLLDYNMQSFDENLGVPETLTQFIVEAQQEYPGARRTILAMLGHGGGWSPNVLAEQPQPHAGQPGIGGLLWDDNALGPQRGTSLSTIELGEALRNAQAKTKRKIDLLYLDACLMGMWEVGAEVADSVEYLFSSESWTFTAFAYDKLLHELETPQTTDQIGRAWVQHKANELAIWGYPFTNSLLNLTQMQSLSQTVNVLGDKLVAVLPTPMERGRITAAFGPTDCFDSDADRKLDRGSATEDGDTYCDLLSFVIQIKNSFSTNPINSDIVNAAQAVEDALRLVVERQNNQYENGALPTDYGAGQWMWGELGGISIYLPLNEKDDWKRQFYGQLRVTAGKHGWREFVNSYRNTPDFPAVPSCADPCSLPPGPLIVRGQIYLPIISR